MQMTIGPLTLKLKYVTPRKDTGNLVYARPVPKALQKHFTGKFIKKDLGTKDWKVAALQVLALEKRDTALFAALTNSPDISPPAVRHRALSLLKARGVAEGDTDSPAADFLLEEFDTLLEAYAGGDEELYRDAVPADYLPPVELETLRMMQGRKPPAVLSDALEFYLGEHDKRDSQKFTSYTRARFDELLTFKGDVSLAAFTNEDARRYVDTLLARGIKTATARRYVRTLAAVFSQWRSRRDPGYSNPFAAIRIRGEGKDSKRRVPFDGRTLQALYTQCRGADDPLRWIAALLIDTGARLAEVVGLALSDLRLDAETPHVLFQPHPWRPLDKSTESTRMVPLVGASLWAARRVVESARTGQMFAFPGYTTQEECKANSVSAALNKWMKLRGIDHVNHELRHAMADRLRNAGCPLEVRYAIEGHALGGVGAGYGLGHGLPIMREWLLKVALKHGGSVEK